MAKAKIKERPRKTKKRVVLELSVKEAVALRALLNRTKAGSAYPRCAYDSIYRAILNLDCINPGEVRVLFKLINNSDLIPIQPAKT